MDIDIDLRLKGKSVTQCCVGYWFTLDFVEAGKHPERTEIRINGQINIDHNGSRLVLDAVKSQEAAQACMMQGKVVSKAIGRKDGSLDMNFGDGTRLVVPVESKYEAWTLSANDGFLVVSRPDGGLSIWNPIPKAG